LWSSGTASGRACGPPLHFIYRVSEICSGHFYDLFRMLWSFGQDFSSWLRVGGVFPCWFFLRSDAFLPGFAWTGRFFVPYRMAWLLWRIRFWRAFPCCSFLFVDSDLAGFFAILAGQVCGPLTMLSYGLSESSCSLSLWWLYAANADSDAVFDELNRSWHDSEDADDGEPNHAGSGHPSGYVFLIGLKEGVAEPMQHHTYAAFHDPLIGF
jgi:hypothetical protein